MACSHFPQLHGSEHNEVSDKLDRLSELPDSLILSILSCLWSTRDVVRTTILSKRWKDLWTTVPCLEFDDENQEFISGVLAQWRGAKIERFCFLCLSDEVPPPTRSDVESWLLFAMEKQVEDLHIYTNVPYCPPQSLYSCSSITTLDLQYCSLEIDGSVQWNQLKNLSIQNPYSLSADAISKLLSGAPHLEYLTLTTLDIDGNFDIVSPRLKTLLIEEAGIYGELTIRAPNLLTLEILASIYNGSSVLCHVPSLTKACIEARDWDAYDPPPEMYDPPLETFYQLLRCICHVKKVELSELSTELLLTMKNKDMVVGFPNAEVLNHTGLLRYIGLLHFLDLLELFPKLKMLSFHQTQAYQDFNPIVVTPFPCPSVLHLNTVEISWSAEDPSIIPFIEFILQNAPLLHKLVFSLLPLSCNRKRFLMIEEKVQSMPRSSPTAEVIIVRK
ncbi:putative F-box protein At1g49610 [Salvia miltiorrhiza]|uniref:putative F-box protein At1g49610 n=1 Tax=Salvia miltiorrhiza TaxID=226208 RepID=UPI0025ACDCDB|nr:putative F-box protein At1g49610 [Salvia miltiorrhiza]